MFSSSKKVNEFQIMRKSCSVTKPTKWSVHSAKTQIRLGIRPVWSGSLLSAWRNLGTLATQSADIEDSDQTGRMSRLIWVFAGCTGSGTDKEGIWWQLRDNFAYFTIKNIRKLSFKIIKYPPYLVFSSLSGLLTGQFVGFVMRWLIS